MNPMRDEAWWELLEYPNPEGLDPREVMWRARARRMRAEIERLEDVLQDAERNVEKRDMWQR